MFVPALLQDDVLRLFHESHPGVSKMKVVVQSHVWWPMMDDDIVATIQECPICQERQRSSLEMGKMAHLSERLGTAELTEMNRHI